MQSNSYWFPCRLLGCFSDTKKLGPTTIFPSNAQLFQRLLEEDVPPLGGAGEGVCPTLKHCSKLFIYLYKMATDSFDRLLTYASMIFAFVDHTHDVSIAGPALSLWNTGDSNMGSLEVVQKCSPL